MNPSLARGLARHFLSKAPDCENMLREIRTGRQYVERMVGSHWRDSTPTSLVKALSRRFSLEAGLDIRPEWRDTSRGVRILGIGRADNLVRVDHKGERFTEAGLVFPELSCWMTTKPSTRHYGAQSFSLTLGSVGQHALQRLIQREVISITNLGTPDASTDLMPIIDICRLLTMLTSRSRLGSEPLLIPYPLQGGALIFTNYDAGRDGTRHHLQGGQVLRAKTEDFALRTWLPDSYISPSLYRVMSHIWRIKSELGGFMGITDEQCREIMLPCAEAAAAQGCWRDVSARLDEEEGDMEAMVA